MNKFYYERNDELLNSPINVTFDQVLSMDDEHFIKWVDEMRKEVVRVWDERGIPPRVGFNEDEMLSQFNQMSNFPVYEFLVADETGNKNCIKNTSIVGNACNQFFENMMRCAVNYTEAGGGASIYDFLSKPEYLKRYMPYAFRHIKRDSYYLFSQCVKPGEGLPHRPELKIDTAEEWIKRFQEEESQYNTHGYWLSEKKKDRIGYTGYNEKLRDAEFLALDCGDTQKYIRLYKKGQKLFPGIFKSFRTSFVQTPVNFPPLTAKFIIERYTEEFKNEQIYYWDPSSGWGGRLLGAMATKDDRAIHYIGNDPNTENSTKDGATKYHKLAEFFNTKTYRAVGLFPSTNTMEFYQLGSEVMQHEPGFQKYKGKLHLVFTSPPYFNREEYSKDKTQSCIAYSQYEDWRDNFLYETLKTAYEWLRPGGYIAWNIADVKFGSKFIPLEKDSCDIMEKLGFKGVEVLKMLLASMPGSGRIDSDGIPFAKNSIKVSGRWMRFEPIWVYKKDK